MKMFDVIDKILEYILIASIPVVVIVYIVFAALAIRDYLQVCKDGYRD